MSISSILEFLRSIGVSGFLDILFMSIVIYSILVWFKRTKAASVVRGMFIIGGAYFLARQLDLELTISVFQGFFAIIIIAVVIIFQEEIKHFLEQIASNSPIARLRGRRGAREPRKEIETLVETVRELAENKTGALIVIQGKDPLGRHLDGGVALGGELSEPLLVSIFNTRSPGHDGAVIISGGTIGRFSCYLPLSKSVQKLWKIGTRHAAALGLAELTDALCLVVSEERGTISVAQANELHRLNSPEELRAILEEFYQALNPLSSSNAWKDFFKKNYREKTVAFAVTAFLWFFLIHESKVQYKTFLVPVTYGNTGTELNVEKIDPPEVEVTFSAPRRSFYLVGASDIKLSLKLFESPRQSVKKNLTRSDFSFPDALSLENIQPSLITVYFKRPAPEGR